MAESLNYIIRDAREDDCKEIFEMKLLLIAHHDPDCKTSITEESKRYIRYTGMRRDGFTDKLPPLFRCLVCEETTANGSQQLAGYLLYFYFYSTSSGKIIWMADLFVRDSCRRKGVASSLMRRIAQIALDEDCKRVRWDWSADNKSVLPFYEGLGVVNRTETGVHLQVLELGTKTLESISTRGDE